LNHGKESSQGSLGGFAMFTDKYGTPWMLNHEGAKAQG
jgi:uncharacterized glyoxalase superfamily protein PhnB